MMNNSTFVRPENFKMDGFLAIHQAMRKEIIAIGQVVQGLGYDDASLPKIGRVDRWFHFYWDMVVVHHETEDKIFFPILVERDRSFGEKMRLLEIDHHELHRLVDSVGQTFKRLLDPQNSANERQLLGGDLRHFTASLHEKLLAHLAREEEIMLPVVAAQLSEKEQLDFEKRLQKTTPREHLAMTLPWIASAQDPATRQKLLATLPLPLRLLYRFSWKGKYEKLTADFQG